MNTDPTSPNPAVLLVDDDRRALLAMAGILRSDDFDLVTVGSAEEALRILEEPARFALVVTDIGLPGKDGVELARIVWQNPAARNLPFTFVTSTFREYARAKEVYELGAADYLEKPLDPLALRAKVRVFVELHRKNQALAAANRELAALNRDLDGFAHSIAHDLRSPLRAIGSYSQMLQEDCAQKLDGEDRRHLAGIITAAGRMHTIIEALMTLSRASRMEMHCGPVDLARLAAAALDPLRRADPERRVEILIQPGLDASGDGDLLNLLLTNLLSNAWKFTAGKADARIEVGAEALAGETVFYVRDNGAGFDPAHAAKLFTLFHRLHSQEEFEGVGIGLSIVQRVAERHGGRVWAEARPGIGAVFRFTLPSATAASPSILEQRQAASPRASVPPNTQNSGEA